MNERWRPSVTVAAVIEEGGRFLLVEEHTPEGLKLNNPAGHLEPGETPLEAVVREALEETGCAFTPEALLGVYLARFVRSTGAPERSAHSAADVDGGAHADEDITYLRFADRGRVSAPLPGATLDAGIVRTLWLTRDEIAAASERHRSPLLMRCIDDHLAGRRFALDAVVGDGSLRVPLRLRTQAATAQAGATMRAMSETTKATADMPPSPAIANEEPRAAVDIADVADVADARAMAHVAAAALVPAAVTAAAPAATEPTAPVTAAALAAVNAAEGAAPVERAEAGDAAPGAAPAAAADAAPDAPPPTPPAQDVRAATAGPAEPTLAETAARLAELFPALFMPGAFKPIKLRVQADIQQRAPGQFTKKQLSIFLHRHTTSTAYIRALVASTQRFDLDGQPAGDVAGEHLEAAKLELERRRQIVMQRRSAGSRGPAARAMPPQGASADGAADAGVGPNRPGGAATHAGAPQGGERGARGAAHDRPPFPAQDRAAPGAAPQGAPSQRPPSNRPPRRAPGDRPQGRPHDGPGVRPNDRPHNGPHHGPHNAPQSGPHNAAQGRPHDAPRDAAHGGARQGPGDGPRDGAHDRPRGRPQGDRPHDRAQRPWPAGPRNGPRNAGPDARAHARPFDPSRGGSRADAGPTEPPLPQDPERRERAQLLRSFEGSPLKAANFSALKGLALPQFEAQIALARRERGERARGAEAPRVAPVAAPAAGTVAAGAAGSVGSAAGAAGAAGAAALGVAEASSESRSGAPSEGVAAASPGGSAESGAAGA